MYSELILLACPSCLFRGLMLMAGFLGLGLLAGWWLWGKYKSMVDGLKTEIKGLKNKLNEREKDFASLKYAHDELEKDNSGMRSSLAGCEGDRAALQASLNRSKTELAAATAAAAAAATTGASYSAGIVDEPAVVEEISPEVDTPVVEIVEETVVEETTDTPEMGAGVAAAAAKEEEDKEDDYLPCKEYEGRTVNDKKNNVALFKHENGQFYFALYNAEGGVRLRSEGFRTAKERDQELSGVLKYNDYENMYQRIGKGRYFIDVLFDDTGREVGRSCLQQLDKISDTGEQTKMGTGVSADTSAEIPTATPTTSGSAALGFASYGSYFDKDNLQIIEGIGPKISRTLQSAGVNNWGDLASKSTNDLEAMLTAAKINTKINNPKTWPEQARLANEGEWEELVKYQKFLDTGMESKGDFETPAKVEKLYLKAIGFAGAKPENLKVVEGIGPKIEGLLKAGGINDWTELANAEVAKIQDILNAAGPRYKLANPSTWPRQAAYAAEGKWSELKSYQDSLNGGR